MSHTPSFTYCSACSLLLNASGGGFRKIFFSYRINPIQGKGIVRKENENVILIVMVMYRAQLSFALLPNTNKKKEAYLHLLSAYLQLQNASCERTE